MLDGYHANRSVFLNRTLVVFVLMTNKVSAKLSILHMFGSELQLDKFFNRLWAFVNNVITRIHIGYPIMISQTCFIDDQGSDWGPFIHSHDLIVTTSCEIRPSRRCSGRIKSYF